MNLVIGTRQVYSIEGDYKRWHYFSLRAALRRLALRKLAKKYPIEVQDHGSMGKEYVSDISYECRCAIVNRYVRMWRRRFRQGKRIAISAVYPAAPPSPGILSPSRRDANRGAR